MRVESIDHFTQVLALADRHEPFPASAMRVPRGKTAGTQKVSLPEGFLDDRYDRTPPSADAELAISGG
jgi:uncharacterized protein YcnI